MKQDEIISELRSIVEYLSWVREGLPYSMDGSDESSYLYTATYRASRLADEISEEGIETEEDKYQDWRCNWTRCEGRQHRRIGYRYLVLCASGVIGVATYKGREKWEGYKGFQFKDVTHFAWLPKKDTAK